MGDLKSPQVPIELFIVSYLVSSGRFEEIVPSEMIAGDEFPVADRADPSSETEEIESLSYLRIAGSSDFQDLVLVDQESRVPSDLNSFFSDEAVQRSLFGRLEIPDSFVPFLFLLRETIVKRPKLANSADEKSSSSILMRPESLFESLLEASGMFTEDLLHHPLILDLVHRTGAIEQVSSYLQSIESGFQQLFL